jgi:hypothetical protein
VQGRPARDRGDDDHADDDEHADAGGGVMMEQVANVHGRVTDAAGRLADPVPDRVQQVAMVLYVVDGVMRRGVMGRAMGGGVRSGLRRGGHLLQA